MSKLRFVEGITTKITRGEHNMYSEGNITSNAGGTIEEIGEDGGVVFSEPKETPPVELPSKCKIEYRPSSDWEGDFGFDWNRKGDSVMPVDNPYSNILGSYGRKYATHIDAVFTPDAAAYRNQTLEYQSFILGTLGTYYVPNMTLMNGKTAVLDALIEVEEEPDSFEYIYDQSIFTLTEKTPLPTAVGTSSITKSVEISCSAEFSSKQVIEIQSVKGEDRKKVGQINILPNNNIKNVNVILIPVNHNGQTGSEEADERQILINAFRQSYIVGNIIEAKEIKVGGWWHDLFFTTKDEHGNLTEDISTFRSIHAVLDNEFFDNDANEIYRSYYRVYMMPPSTTLNGIAAGIGGNAKAVVVYKSRSKSTTAHELLHNMGLYHTFDNDALHTYKIKKTDNIMDYTHHINKERFSTNMWQWKILN